MCFCFKNLKPVTSFLSSTFVYDNGFDKRSPCRTAEWQTSRWYRWQKLRIPVLPVRNNTSWNTHFVVRCTLITVESSSMATVYTTEWCCYRWFSKKTTSHLMQYLITLRCQLLRGIEIIFMGTRLLFSSGIRPAVMTAFTTTLLVVFRISACYSRCSAVVTPARFLQNFCDNLIAKSCFVLLNCRHLILLKIWLNWRKSGFHDANDFTVTTLVDV